MNRLVAPSIEIKRTAPPSPLCGKRTKRSMRLGMRMSAFIGLPSLARASCRAIEKRMAAIGGFLKHTAVEVEPRELAVNEAFRACRNGRFSVAAGRLGEPRRRLQLPLQARFERNNSPLATVDHGSPYVLSPTI